MDEFLHVFGIDARLILVQVVNFGILLGVLWLILYQPLMRMITTRQEKIAPGVKDAERASTQLSAVADEKKKILGGAAKEAETMLSAATARAAAREQEILKAAAEKQDRLLADAQAKAQEEKRRALEESKEEMARLIVLGAQKVLEKKTQ